MRDRASAALAGASDPLSLGPGAPAALLQRHSCSGINDQDSLVSVMRPFGALISDH